VVSPEIGLKLDQVGLEVLGTARRIVITRTTPRSTTAPAAPTRFRPGSARSRRDRADRLGLGPEKLQERLAKLAGRASA
jgi:chaperonin GroEL